VLRHFGLKCPLEYPTLKPLNDAVPAYNLVLGQPAEIDIVERYYYYVMTIYTIFMTGPLTL